MVFGWSGRPPYPVWRTGAGLVEELLARPVMRLTGAARFGRRLHMRAWRGIGSGPSIAPLGTLGARPRSSLERRGQSKVMSLPSTLRWAGPPSMPAVIRVTRAVRHAHPQTSLSRAQPGAIRLRQGSRYPIPAAHNWQALLTRRLGFPKAEPDPLMSHVPVLCRIATNSVRWTTGFAQCLLGARAEDLVGRTAKALASGPAGDAVRHGPRQWPCSTHSRNGGAPRARQRRGSRHGFS